MDELIQKYIKKKISGDYYEKFLYLFGKGKRIRPKIIKMICERYNKDFHPLLAAATAVEMMHCASLAHDDIIDKEELRRNKLPFYKKFGMSSAVLFGDFFAALSMEIFYDEYPNNLCVEFIKTFKGMIEGQLMEPNENIVDYDSYIKYIEKKTGTLFNLCAKVPYLYYNLNDKKILESIKEFGILFQIADDLSSSEEEKYNILNFISKKEAVNICKEKIRKIKDMKVLDLDKLDLNFSIK